jgi:hypothetical protein
VSTDFDSDSLNLGVQPVQYYVDSDGSLKFISEYISSSNFNGTIPVIDTVITASAIDPGMYISITGSAVASQYFPVVSIEKDDPDLEDSPSTSMTVSYLNGDNTKESITFDQLDLVAIRYEDWEEKTLGSLGWAITSGGNAIFSNVAVRGDLEATTLDVGGDLGITYDGTTVTLGASVVINAPVTFNGSGSFVTFEDLDEYALESYVDLISSSVDYLISASLVSEVDLITNGATKINGNNITTGTLDANNVLISSGLTGLRGVKINSLGLFAYNSGGTETFSINSGTGNVTLNGGTLTITSGSNIDGYSTDAELNSASSLLNSSIITASNNLAAQDARRILTGSAALDIVSNSTSITGGNIKTGTIQSQSYSYTSGNFSNNGLQINLDSFGYIRGPKFFINGQTGDAFFQGNISGATGTIGGFNINSDSLTVGTSPNIVGVTSTTNSFFAGATSVAGAGARFSVTNAGSLTATNANISGIVTASGGVFGPASNPINLINQGTNSILDMGTIKMVANVTSGNRYGSLRFYETNGTTSVGELNTAITNKTWYTYVGSQNGLVMGTTSDFYYVPTSSPSRRGRYQGNGFEVVSQDGSNLFSVGGGSADVTIGTSTNSKATNIYGITTILGGNRLEVSNGNFRLINTSNSYIPFIVNNGSSAGGTTANVTARAIYDYTTTSTANIFIDGSATLRRFQSSTEKIKKDIEPISASFSILEVEVVQFKYKEETLPEEDERFNKIVPGFIAEQVYQVLPIAVDLNEGEPENWNDRYLIPVMVKTIQDQQKTIEELTNKLYSIEQRLESAGI